MSAVANQINAYTVIMQMCSNITKANQSLNTPHAYVYHLFYLIDQRISFGQALMDHSHFNNISAHTYFDLKRKVIV